MMIVSFIVARFFDWWVFGFLIGGVGGYDSIFTETEVEEGAEGAAFSLIFAHAYCVDLRTADNGAGVVGIIKGLEVIICSVGVVFVET